MSRRDRIFQLSTALLVVLHVAAAWLVPGSLWGASHLAVWPRAAVLAWTSVTLVVLFVVPPRILLAAEKERRGAPASARSAPFPGLRAPVLLALAGGLLFALLRERTHFFGDGYLLVRDRGQSETVTRALLLVRGTLAAVRAGEQVGLQTEASFAALAIVAGVAAVFLVLRLAASLSEDRGGRWLAAALLLGAGSMQLFCGHVEYYAALAAGVLAWLWAACRAAAGKGSAWVPWLVLAVLVPLHLATLALAPAQVVLAVHDWRRGAHRATLAAAAASVVLGLVLVRAAGGELGALAGTALGGFGRYWEPFRAATSARHAFGFLSPPHLLAVANDLLLVAPMALAALPALWLGRKRRPDPVQQVLGTAALGGVSFSLLFNRELGAYRDWDILAWCGFVLLAWVASWLVRPHPGRQRAAAAIALAGGLFHLVPWVVMQTSPGATLRHLERVLAAPSQWSRHARGYLYEEIGLWKSQRGDREGSLRAYEAAVAAHPGDARFRVGLGTRYVERGDLDRAAAEFEVAVRVRPDYAPANNNLAYVLLVQDRDLARARRLVEAALAARPDDPHFLLTRARLEHRTGDREAARADVEAVLRLRPGWRDAEAFAAELADADSLARPAGGRAGGSP